MTVGNTMIKMGLVMMHMLETMMVNIGFSVYF